MTVRSVDDLQLVTRPDFDPNHGILDLGGGATLGIGGLSTPDAFRVQISENQAVVGFPKFGTIGVGFDAEDDGNTNLPYSVRPALIADHIDHNRCAGGDEAVPRDVVLAAITLIRDAVGRLKAYGVCCRFCMSRARVAADAGEPDPTVGLEPHWHDDCPLPGALELSAYEAKREAERGRDADGWLNPWPDEDEL